MGFLASLVLGLIAGAITKAILPGNQGSEAGWSPSEWVTSAHFCEDRQRLDRDVKVAVTVAARLR